MYVYITTRSFDTGSVLANTLSSLVSHVLFFGVQTSEPQHLLQVRDLVLIDLFLGTPTWFFLTSNVRKTYPLSLDLNVLAILVVVVVWKWVAFSLHAPNLLSRESRESREYLLMLQC